MNSNIKRLMDLIQSNINAFWDEVRDYGMTLDHQAALDLTEEEFDGSGVELSPLMSMQLDAHKRAEELGISGEPNEWDTRELGADPDHAKVSGVKTMSKFTVGQKVFHMGWGIGTVTSVSHTEPFPVRVDFANNQMEWFTQDGAMNVGYKIPQLYSLDEARKMGFDIPRQKVTKEIKVWKIYNTMIKDFESVTLEYTADLGWVDATPHLIPVLLSGKLEIKE